MDIKEVLLQLFIMFFVKKASGSSIKNENISNRELGKELHKPIVRKFKKRKLQPRFIGNIWGVVLANMEAISKFNTEFRVLLCVFDIYSKYNIT